MEQFRDYAATKLARINEFYRYYSVKRAAHQHMQLSMLEKPVKEGVESLVEVGPFLGYATGLFQALGLKVKTIDFFNGQLGALATEHVTASAADITPEMLTGADMIVCCETLEHLEWDVACDKLRVFSESGVPWLLISVPCNTWYGRLELSFSPTHFFAKCGLKFPPFLKTFQKESGFGHKWELGYKGFPMRKLLAALQGAGWQIENIQHEVKNRSVFILCRQGGM